MTFNSFKLSRWRQYENIDILFHPRLTILTGANGAGKTTVLNLLSRHYGWTPTFVSTPERESKIGLKYLTDLWQSWFTQSKPTTIAFGSIVYSDGTTSQLSVPTENAQGNYQININGIKPINGIHIPSHRPVFYYTKVSQIPTMPPKKKAIFENHRNYIQRPFNGGHVDKPANTLMKETLIALAVFGEGNSHVSSDIEALRLFNGFQEVLKMVLPEDIGFLKLQIENPEVILVTSSGNFSLDAVSGGIAAILDIVWQIYMASEGEDTFVVTIDEPENHLHPKLQRTFLPNLLKAFPKAQFVVVTHNPFVVTSVPESNVYVLDYNEEKRVFSRNLDLVNRAGDANEILTDVLGLPTPSPIWVEQKIDHIVTKYSSAGLTKENVDALRKELIDAGLGTLFTDTLVKIKWFNFTNLKSQKY